MHPFESLRSRLALGAGLAVVGSTWLHWLNTRGVAESGGLTPLLHWARDASLSLLLLVPAVLVALRVSDLLAARSTRWRAGLTALVVASVASAAFAVGAVGHGLIFPSEHAGGSSAAAAAQGQHGAGASADHGKGWMSQTARPGYQQHGAPAGWPSVPVKNAAPAGLLESGSGAAASTSGHGGGAGHNAASDGHHAQGISQGPLQGLYAFPLLHLLTIMSIAFLHLFRHEDPVGAALATARRALPESLLRSPVRRAAPVLTFTHRQPRRVRALALTGVMTFLGAMVSAVALPATTAVAANGICAVDARPVVYDVAAFQVAIPLNGWGDTMPNGLMYALKGADAVVNKDKILANPNLTQPLVIRANVGDCITIKVRNDITGRRIGLSTQGLVQADVKDSDGTRVGNNPDSTIATGMERSYTWYADKEGEAPLYDAANLDEKEDRHSSIALGLYGAVVVHPRGATWHNQVTGQNLLAPDGRAVDSQLFADVRAGAASTRSAVLIFGDENEDIVDRDGNQPTYPLTGLKDSTFGFNYRSEPLRNRLRATLEHRGTKTPENPTGIAKTITLPNGKTYTPADNFCNGFVPELGRVVADPGARCLGEESHLQSWVYGDEGKLTRKLADGTIVTDSDNLIPKAYVGDPLMFHVVHPGVVETHPYHQHTQRWNADPNNAKSPLNDVQSMGPGEARRLVIEGGAGGQQRTAGDSIFHCHLYPHFAQGFWGHLRIFDRLRDGTQQYADATPIQTLQELPNRFGATPAATAEQPGFPLFVKGDFGQRAYRPPNAVVKDDFAALRRPGDAPRGPNVLEAAGMPALDPAKPGNGFVDPCPTSAATRVYRPHAIDTPITYNSAGWKDPQGRVYVEEVDVGAVRAGTKQPEPYTIRARVGECVQMYTSNDLHLDEDPNVPLDHVNRLDGVYMNKEETSEVSTHVHLVHFDQLASDGTSVGWNYSSSAMPGQTYGYRWFVDVALRTTFFHDHQYANLHQQKGLYAAMNIEPADATWHDPKTGNPTNGVGTVADIRSPSGPDFREMTIFYSDRTPMWKNDGAGPAVNPPSAPDNYGQDQGGGSINYRNEPFQIRTKAGAAGQRGDPAYTYSSAVHGDPSTPVFRAYAKDPVVIRNVAGSHEEMHQFNLHGHRWLNEPDNPLSRVVDTQTLSLAEYFNYEVSGSRVVKTAPGYDATLEQAAGGGEQALMNGTPSLVQDGAGTPGDYLYGSPLLEDQWLGMWGIFRVPATQVPDLVPLPDRASPGTVGSSWPALKPGEAVRKPPQEAFQQGDGNPCPPGSNVVPIKVSAIAKDIVYNAKNGDHDPYGLMYVLTEEKDKVLSGEMKTEPLVVRAGYGECIRVELTNELPATLPVHTGDLPLPADVPSFPRSNRVSMHPSLMSYDVTDSDGATVGYNFDQTIAPGETITYTWYAPPGIEDGAVNLLDFGDRRGHRHHGLYGSMMIEPVKATFVEPNFGASIKSGAQANVTSQDSAGNYHRFREFVLNFADGLVLRDRAGNIVPFEAQGGEPGDMGHRAINYRAERFAPRLAQDPEVANVMSSQVHGDPETPIMRAYVGDPTHIRWISGGDRDRAHTWILNGHSWRYQPGDPNSMLKSAEGGLLTGSAFNFDLEGGAGGRQRLPGDYLYRDGNLNNQVNAGLWGILRVEDGPKADLKPLQ